MTAPNHVVGGFVFTGVVGSFFDWNILSSPLSIGLCVFVSLLPDIDFPKSPLGYLLPFISKPLNRYYGHRTVTHTVFALLIVTALFAPFGYGGIVFLAYASHLLFDMLTLQGVPLMYPLQKNAYVFPARPELRIRTGDRRAEFMYFSVFALSGVFMQPLLKDGFWTTYNRSFGTLKHLASEKIKSTDLLLAHYQIREGTAFKQGSGYVMEATESKAVLIENADFKIIDKSAVTVLKIIPEHTKRQLIFKDIAFVGITTDSLNALLNGQFIREIEILSNCNFRVGEGAETKSYKAEWVKTPSVKSIEPPLPERALRFENPHIQTLRLSIELERLKKQDAVEKAAAQVARIAFLEAELKTVQSYSEREHLQTTLSKIDVDTPNLKLHDYDIKQLEQQIREIRMQDKIQAVKDSLDYVEKVRMTEGVYFTGRVRVVVVE
jgi:inner membrane protein